MGNNYMDYKNATSGKGGASGDGWKTLILILSTLFPPLFIIALTLIYLSDKQK